MAATKGGVSLAKMASSPGKMAPFGTPSTLKMPPCHSSLRDVTGGASSRDFSQALPAIKKGAGLLQSRL
jgi:hypothetical protein